MHTAPAAPVSAPPPQAASRALIEAAKRLQPALTAIARRHVRCPFLAEDVVQDVLLRILDRPAAEAVDQPEAYLGRMVRNLAIDRARRRGFEQRLFAGADEAVACPATCAFCPEATVEGCEALRRLESAVAALPKTMREAFTLHRIEGVPQKEVAARLGLSPARICGLVQEGHALCAAAVAGEVAALPRKGPR